MNDFLVVQCFEDEEVLDVMLHYVPCSSCV